MATYKQIREYVQQRFDFEPKTCWIADVKEQNGLSPRARNRLWTEQQVPCPLNKVEPIYGRVTAFSLDLRSRWQRKPGNSTSSGADFPFFSPRFWPKIR